MVLEITRSSYYSWLKRPIPKRKKNDSLLVAEIKEFIKIPTELMVLEELKNN